jgi:hypothetical protein
MSLIAGVNAAVEIANNAHDFGIVRAGANALFSRRHDRALPVCGNGSAEFLLGADTLGF